MEKLGEKHKGKMNKVCAALWYGQKTACKEMAERTVVRVAPMDRAAPVPA